MKNKIFNKKSFLSKLFIKLIRKFGYEVIDQANLEIQGIDQPANENVSQSGIKSITVPLGSTKIKNKINSLCIIIRSYTFGDIKDERVMLDQNKQRIYELPKIEYTLRTINSIIKSCEFAKKYFKNLDVNIIVTDDKSNSESLERISKILNQTSLKTKIINLDEKEFINQIKSKDINGNEISKNMISNMRNILKSIFLTKTDVGDLVYFVEDDYIHEENAISEMLYTYEKISTQIGRELFLCPADYPYLYRNLEKTNIFIGNQRHWRTVKETLITFLTSKKMILKYLDDLIILGTIRHHPMEKKLHDIYQKELCLSPIPSLAMHATNVNSSYGIPPNFDWINNWENNKID